jgi:hypothetical protein
MYGGREGEQEGGREVEWGGESEHPFVKTTRQARQNHSTSTAHQSITIKLIFDATGSKSILYYNITCLLGSVSKGYFFRHQEKTCENFIPYSMKWATVKKSSSFHTIKLVFHTYTYSFIPSNVISYLIGIISYILMLFHTATTCFIRVDIISYLRMNFVCLHCIIPKPLTTCFIRICIVSNIQMSFYTCHNLFHTYRYCFIQYHTCHFQCSYLSDIVSYLHMSFHTCNNLFHTSMHCFKPTHVISYLRHPVSYVQVLFHTYTCHFQSSYL